MSFNDSFYLDPGLGYLVDECVADRDAVARRYPLTLSATRLERMARLVDEWKVRLGEVEIERLGAAGKLDYALLRNHLEKAAHDVERSRKEAERLRETVPFSQAIVELSDAREATAELDPAEAAAALDIIAMGIASASPVDGDAPAAWAKELQGAIERWSAFYVGYDPTTTWWVREPLGRVAEGLRLYLEAAKVPGTEIPGRAVGREELLKDLEFEMVPYSPEELIAIGDREYAWCLEEMLRASRELGFGEDWKAALEHVKETFVPAGQQTRVVRDLALEAIDYVEGNDLLTVPALAKETWRMEMMSPERQKVNPFFLGGETIIVSYAADSMTPEERRMSMRGNNPNFSRATVQHELIPGHHMQMYMTERFRKYRQLFSTPFWIEGWTLYWELLLWELGFPRTPEERIGMLFWRMHRCVRVSFSLRFHLGEMTTAECVEILVERVGHERANAEGEVRRSFNGMYPPLYQAAYMIGGLQFRAISRELRAKGWSFREIHDAMLRENEMPPALMRLALLGEEPPREGAPIWRFDS